MAHEFIELARKLQIYGSQKYFDAKRELLQAAKDIKQIATAEDISNIRKHLSSAKFQILEIDDEIERKLLIDEFMEQCQQLMRVEDKLRLQNQLSGLRSDVLDSKVPKFVAKQTLEQLKHEIINLDDKGLVEAFIECAQVVCENENANATNTLEDNIQALTDKLGQMQKAINEAMITCANAGTTVLSPEQLL